MLQLLKRCLALLLLYQSCLTVYCDDVVYMNGIEGQNLTVPFTFKNTIQSNSRVYVYQDSTKTHSCNISQKLCLPSVNHTLLTIYIKSVSQGKICLIFPHLVHSGVYNLAVFAGINLGESNKVNLTVHPAKYTTNTTVTAASPNNTSFQLEQLEKNLSILMFVPLLVVVVMLLIVLFGTFYWRYRWKTEKTADVNSTSPPQVIPDVTCVEYCVLDFPDRPGEKVRSSEDRVEYSPIMFPPRKPAARDNETKSTTQKSKTKVTTLQHEARETGKVSDKPKASKPKHQRGQKKAQCQVQKAQV
ncbi:uncharacterized protein Hap1MRO34_017163 [Clarias gariepinus]